MAQHGTTWHNMAQHGTTWHNIAQHGTTCERAKQGKIYSLALSSALKNVWTRKKLRHHSY